MSDDKTKLARDRKRIALGEDYEVKYWTEKKVDRQSDEVKTETSEKSSRCDTFNLRNLARACGTKMIVE